MSDLQRIPFHAADIETARADDGTIYAVPKRFCEHVGVSWQGQLSKLKENEVFAEGINFIFIPSDGGLQETVLLRQDLVPAWLLSISLNRIKDPKKRALLKQFQKESARVLADYWLHANRAEHPLIAQAKLVLAQAEHIARVEAVAQQAKEESAQAKEMALHAYQAAQMQTVAEFVFFNTLQAQVHRSLYQAFGTYVSGYCFERNIPMRDVPIPGKTWKTEKAYPSTTLHALLWPWLRTRDGHLPISGLHIEEDGVRYGADT